MVKENVRCIFVLVLFKICFGRLSRGKIILKAGFFAVTIKANRKNDQVQGIVDSTLFYNVSSYHIALSFQSLRQSCSSSRQMISCRRLIILLI